ncbi:MAG: low molecular weight protein-tyrosine-phosphatase [Fluviibacter sp.]
MLRILVVCTANICRSPMGELLLRQALHGHDVQVDSAGIHGQHGMSADETVARLLHENRLPEIDTHKSKPVVSGMSGQYDLYLCMENHHMADLKSMIPNATGRIYLFGHWQKNEIPDPVTKPEIEYRKAYAAIDEAAKAWPEKLAALGLLS